MTPTESEQVRTIVKQKWPRVRWETEEWADFTAGLVNLTISVEQAGAALSNLKRTSEKYPTVAGLLKAILGACPRSQTRASEERADAPESVEYMLGRWRRMLGMDSGSPRSVVVQAWYRDAFARSVRLRGVVRESAIGRAHADLIEIGGFGSLEADTWVYEANAEAEAYARRIDCGPMRARWANTARMDGIGLVAIVKRKAEEAEAQEAQA